MIKKFKEIYDKFGVNYYKLIEENHRVLDELEKYLNLLDEQMSNGI